MKTEESNHTIASYLSFKLQKESFAVGVSKVIEIMEVPAITRVPRSPDYMRGVINLRGTVLPVVDTRLKFGLPKVADSINTCIIVFSIQLEAETIMVGALVDAVQEVFEFNEESLMPPPSMGGRYKNEFIRGMARQDDDFIMVLDVDKIFSHDEIIHIRQEEEEATV